MTIKVPSDPPQRSETTDALPSPTKRRDPYEEFDEGALAIETLEKFIAKQERRKASPTE